MCKKLLILTSLLEMVELAFAGCVADGDVFEDFIAEALLCLASVLVSNLTWIHGTHCLKKFIECVFLQATSKH